MAIDTDVKLAVYRHLAETGAAPTAAETAERAGVDEAVVLQSWLALREERVLVLGADGTSIRMAPPFSGVPTQHRVRSEGVAYFANCAWDALGIPAALGRPAVVESRCEQSLEPLVLEIGVDGPAGCDWLFHCLVPAARWWEDIVFT